MFHLGPASEEKLLQFCQLLLILMVILMLMASPELLIVVGHLLVMVEFAVKGEQSQEQHMQW